jgi:hypothetical protein
MKSLIKCHLHDDDKSLLDMMSQENTKIRETAPTTKEKTIHIFQRNKQTHTHTHKPTIKQHFALLLFNCRGNFPMSSFAVSSDGVKVSKDHPFLLDKHVAYISMISADRESFEYVASQHFRMSGVYWGITAMSLLGKDLKEAMNTEEIITWVMQCQHESGG